ncbi:protein cordon-bleu-like isoform X2 [Corvus kubaryi]|uniref:protein cordon-bleu-like isoform X2 n=1 Tax=Corvus kubaryi TaxID=68294 RepID=UPI001C056892|nr:protein cordon-bleu-like isoform X2 [Corvus kubaryi]
MNRGDEKQAVAGRARVRQGVRLRKSLHFPRGQSRAQLPHKHWVCQGGGKRDGAGSWELALAGMFIAPLSRLLPYPLLSLPRRGVGGVGSPPAVPAGAAAVFAFVPGSHMETGPQRPALPRRPGSGQPSPAAPGAPPPDARPAVPGCGLPGRRGCRSPRRGAASLPARAEGGPAMETLVRPGASKPPTGKRMKARAPPPPNQPSAASRIHGEHKSPAETAVISDQNLVSMKENMINRLVDFTVILPCGLEQKCTVQGSKAVMDVLVDLCSQYRLNPSQHSLELKSSGTQQVLSYKPNTLIGALDVQTVLLKEKIPEEKAKRPLPRVPEKSVRLVVNYLKTQKAVVRVSPEVPLHNIIPAICEKCEVSQEHIVLLRDGITGEELELTKSLEELGIKELYAWDRKKEPNRKASVSSDAIEKEKTRLLGLFNADRRSSKGFSTAPNSPSVNSRSSSLGSSLSLGSISGMTANPEVKKRRAPPPPAATPVLPNAEVRGQEGTAAQISQGASLSDLRKKKRRAPLPPAASAPPTPAMPNRTEDREDKRKSTMVYCCASFPSYSKRV